MPHGTNMFMRETKQIACNDMVCPGGRANAFKTTLEFRGIYG